jgi:citronellol/citronellal dehydrogenase
MKERGGGAILNVSSLAALNYVPGLMAYGMSKIALEHLTVSLAAQLKPFGIAVNTFRIDVPVASEGFVANTPGLDRSDWEPTEVAAEGIVWMLRRPPSYTGHNAGMANLRAEHGIMASKAERPHRPSGAMVYDTPLQLRRDH